MQPRLRRALSVGALLLGLAGTGRAELPPPSPAPGQVWHDSLTGADYCYCPPGEFLMGSATDDPDHTDDQGPAHRVTLSKGFWIGRFPASRALWQRVMKGQRPEPGKAALPVTGVSWQDCERFFETLNAGGLRLRYRLPTEAEWEYACRAGSPEPTRGELQDWIDSGFGTTRAKAPVNAWQIEDMIGSVWQWCADVRGPYAAAPVTDPAGPAEGTYRICRGSPPDRRPSRLQSYYRWSFTPDFRDDTLGFRIVVPAP